MKGMVFVDYTPEQYAFMEKLSGGFFLHNMTDDEREMFTDLDRLKLIQPREDIADNYCTLTQQGLRVLSAHRTAELVRAENVRREQAQKKEQLEQIIRDKAERQAERAAEHRFQARLSLWNTAFGIVLGAIFGNLDRLIPVLAEAVSAVVARIASLF